MMRRVGWLLGLVWVASLVVGRRPERAYRTASGVRPARVECDPSYPTVCIPPAPPDLDCPDIPYSNFAVRGADPHGFDADHDGIGCERGP
jgi:hypothetical protein